MAMGGEAVRVIGTIGSGFSHRVEVALRLKGVPYEFIQEDLRNKSELLLTHNPVHKMVPVVLHGDRAISESLVIVDDAFDGPPLLLTDLYDHATARFWAQFIDQKFAMPFWMSFLSVDGGAEQEEVLKEAKENLLLLEEQLKGRRFFGGDAIGLVDIPTNGFAGWLGVLEEISGVTVVTDEEFPALCRWATRYVDDETLKECLPSRDELVTMFSASRDMFRVMAAAPNADVGAQVKMAWSLKNMLPRSSGVLDSCRVFSIWM